MWYNCNQATPSYPLPGFALFLALPTARTVDEAFSFKGPLATTFIWKKLAGFPIYRYSLVRINIYIQNTPSAYHTEVEEMEILEISSRIEKRPQM